ncbi:Phosphoacetylglucosamine mutase [Eremomyces bilateralis CBS 781.70]|uniref:Phosphoacetylglucosamine mutase n=1 Tax=Eremomyces bilateralis CBS 781.70 TaxID=1392243 RepID=A0A6G1G519_9PEZI|nr:Phosphoacetylglucosamine mutase [Eremomyces bilateralis CBS 781.70]KAF1813031.1 Phosphoacetylglucosamine mutase [Eremomyces bilateralis CBS 781.70]
MSDVIPKALLEATAKHPKGKDLVFQYGTAGFRLKANLLGSVVFRVGLLAALRSRKFNGQTIGVMITASHNPPEDNGVKLVDPMGDMLEGTWEQYATLLANAGNDEALVEAYEQVAEELKVNLNAPARVVFARDTRASGFTLAAALVDGLKALNVEYVDFKILTTPQLHYLVRCINTKGTHFEYGEPTEQGYYQKIATAFKNAMADKKPKGSVTVDCANGVGGPKLHEMIKYLPPGMLDIRVVNDDVLKPEALNVQCGADFVKTQQRPPPSSKAAPHERHASLDGDADRVVYYFLDRESNFRLLDGDRIATLAAGFLGNLVKLADLSDEITLGVVQTAYANGASTKYLTDVMKLPVVCTSTGVKHLHHAAQRFDIGIYFEANGHGTVLFSPDALKAIETRQPKSPHHASTLKILTAVTNLINQAVGDAISDMLLAEVILAHMEWKPENWLATYTDLPNRLVRVEVRDRTIFKATDSERRLESPKGAQDEIDKLAGKFCLGRSFARASGTEDAVRVYAEAATRGECDELARGVVMVVQKYGAL